MRKDTYNGHTLQKGTDALKRQKYVCVCAHFPGQLCACVSVQVCVRARLHAGSMAANVCMRLCVGIFVAVSALRVL